MKKLLIAIAVVAVAVVAYVGFSRNVGQVNVGATAFPVKADLPFADQQLLVNTLAVPVAQRTASQSAYLTARATYIYNEIFTRDSAGDILGAQGQTLPTGYTGFAKGATFIVIDASNNIRAQYENTGTNTSAIWKVIGQQTATVTLSSASFDTLGTTAVQAVPSCGSGTVIALSNITGYRVFSSESWSPASIDDGLEVKYDSANGAPVIASFSKGFLDGNGTSSVASPSYEVRYAIQPTYASPSDGLYFTTASNPSIDGDTYFKFDIKYNCVTLP